MDVGCTCKIYTYHFFRYLDLRGSYMPRKIETCYLYNIVYWWNKSSRQNIYTYARQRIRWMATDDCWLMRILHLLWMSWVAVRHLAEFWMIEPELAFADIFDDMTLAEAPTGHNWAGASCSNRPLAEESLGSRTCTGLPQILREVRHGPQPCGPGNC